MFKCCSNQPQGHFYQLSTKLSITQSKLQYVKLKTQFKDKFIGNPNCRVRQMHKSQYQTLRHKLKAQNTKWIDPIFYPQDQHIGKQAKNKQIKWKRITQIVTSPVLYKKQDKSYDNMNLFQQLYESANLFSILCLIQADPQIIEQLLQRQQINQSGIYKVKLNINGQIEEVLVDDFFPVDQQNVPIFMKAKDNQIWMMLIQKARAKVYGSYQLMFQKANQPELIFQQMLTAPIISLDLNMPEQKQKNWKLINQCLHQRQYAVCVSNDNQKQLDILPKHPYCILEAKQFLGKDQNVNRILKLKNFCNCTIWKGRANNIHNSFWDSISENSDKNTLFKNIHQKGTFFMLYEDFIQCFINAAISKYIKFCNYFSQQLSFSTKNGKVFDLTVKSKGIMHISINQQKFQLAQNKDQKSECCLIIFKLTQANYLRDYQLVAFNNKPNKYGAVNLQTYVNPGSYVIYCKLYPTTQNYYPSDSKLLLYSPAKFLIDANNQEHKSIIKRSFMNHAKINKRQFYQGQLMWMSWKYFEQMNYGYIAFGVSPNCKKHFQILINQSDFTQSGLSLKKPLKGVKGDQTIVVERGKQDIILVRKIKNLKKKIKFPAKMDIKIQQNN